MSDPFWGAIVLPLLFNWNPTVAIHVNVSDIVAVVEADEPASVKGFLLLPLADGKCEADHAALAEDLAQIWPSLDEVGCQVTDRYSYMQVRTEITLAPPSYEGMTTPEIVIEARHVGADNPAFADLTLRSSKSLERLVEALTEYASPIPVPEISLSLVNDSPQAISLAPSEIAINDKGMEPGQPIDVKAGNGIHFTLSNVASMLVSQGKDHRFGTLAFLPPGD